MTRGRLASVVTGQDVGSVDGRVDQPERTFVDDELIGTTKTWNNFCNWKPHSLRYLLDASLEHVPGLDVSGDQSKGRNSTQIQVLVQGELVEGALAHLGLGILSFHAEKGQSA